MSYCNLTHINNIYFDANNSRLFLDLPSEYKKKLDYFLNMSPIEQVINVHKVYKIMADVIPSLKKILLCLDPDIRNSMLDELYNISKVQAKVISNIDLIFKKYLIFTELLVTYLNNAIFIITNNQYEDAKIFINDFNDFRKEFQEFIIAKSYGVPVHTLHQPIIDKLNEYLNEISINLTDQTTKNIKTLVINLFENYNTNCKVIINDYGIIEDNAELVESTDIEDKNFLQNNLLGEFELI